MLPEVLLDHGLEPLRAPRAGQELPGERERLVHDRAVVVAEPDPETGPLRVSLAAVPRLADGGLERPDRLAPGALDPARLRVADGDGEDGLRVAQANLARGHRGP